MKKIISILLLVSHTSLLFADTLTFKSGQKIEGELIKVSEEHELDPNTGTTSEVTFKVDKFSISMIPKEMIVGKLNENIFLFDQKSIYKITNDYGQILLIRPFKYGSDGEFIEIPKSDKGEHDELIEGIGKAANSIGNAANSKVGKTIAGTVMAGVVVFVIIPMVLFIISLANE